MVSGFNTNIRHRGVLFHVQSEASGINNPHILTHLFKGGDILASMKLGYAEKLDTVDSDALEAEVRGMMEGQHKKMLRGLTRGEHDEAIISRLGLEIFDEEKGPDSDVTIPPAEILEPVPTVKEVPTAVPAALAEPESAKEQLTRAFGDGVVSQKPLDEVVLDFLVDNARKRKRPPK